VIFCSISGLQILILHKDLDERGRGLIEALVLHFPGGTEENHKNTGHDNRYHRRDLNSVSPEYKSTALPLDQPGR
jgi:hypothetical protein